MGEMHLLNGTGHSTLEWDLKIPESWIEAEKEFQRLRKEGYTAFQRDHAHAEAQRLDKFEPAAEEIVWLRPLQGG